MIDLNHKAESRHCIECFRCIHPEAKGGLKLIARWPGTEVAQIRKYNPNAAEIWFLFLATGLSIGGFLWLVLPQYDRLRQLVGTWAIQHGWYWIGISGPAWLMSVHPGGREIYTWLDFFMITVFMLTCAVALTAVLAALTSLSSWIAGTLGADLRFRARFVEQAYAYMPVAMVSLVIGLGSELFDALPLVGVPTAFIPAIKLGLFGLGVLWSLVLGRQLLVGQGLRGAKRSLVLLPLFAGVVAIGLAWWPAIFGI
jgi:hypothetical protein